MRVVVWPVVVARSEIIESHAILRDIEDGKNFAAQGVITPAGWVDFGHSSHVCTTELDALHPVESGGFDGAGAKD
jgi:hypothetical protein